MTRAPSLFLFSNITKNDAYHIAKWLRNKEITRYLNEDCNVVDSIDTLINGVCPHLLTYHFNKDGRFFIINCDTAPIGYVKLIQKSESNTYEVVIVIGDEKLWGMGLGRLAIQKCLDMVFFEWRADRIIAKIHNKNIRSKNLFTNAGFTPLYDNGNTTTYQVTFNNYIYKSKNKRS